ncbi:MAG: YidC/Oxa1 family membrane protein insertase [Lachnospiraceae bacterium]|nr:YidC/Oxa1 family membrane protein insertase [Lachnospiraceae bacterium]
MYPVVLTQVGGLLKPFAWFFGLIFNWLYELLALIGIENIAVTLVLFTIIIKMLMLPLTVKQQRFSKLSAKMQPELSAVQEKFKGRKDETSQRLMAAEQQKVYEKYGTSPASGCLPILITLPIIFAMYRIIYAIPAYVSKINDLYTTIANAAMGQEGYFDFFKGAAESLAVSIKKWDETGSGVFTLKHIIDILTKFGTENWASLRETFPTLDNAAINGSIDKINSIFSVFGLNILNSPSYYARENGFFNIALIVPVLAVVTQLGSSLLQKAQNKTGNNKKDDNPMAQSMNSMLYIMPFMSGFFCYGFSLVIGIYWIIQTVVSLLQQVFINIYLDHTDMEAYIAKNSAKLAKKREKLGVLQNSSAVSNLAKYQTKSIDYSQPAPVKTTSSYANMSASSKNVSKKNDASSQADNDNTNAESADVQVKAPEKKSVSAYANLLKRD